MGETLPESVSRAEFNELAGAVKEVRDSLAELAQARSEPERRDAEEGVRGAKADLAAVARELGLDPGRLEKAAQEAKASDERERLRPILVELLDEELAPAADDLKDAAADVKDDVKDAAADVKDDPPAPPKPDSGPTISHWSEKPLSALFGGGNDA